MEIQEQKQGAVTVVKPLGPLVQPDTELLKARLLGVMGASHGRFVVDASGVPYADSRGLEVLAEITEELSKLGQGLRMCGAGETLREVLDITDLAASFEHYEDVQSAVRSFL